MNIRNAGMADLSRIAEIYVFNNRINYFPIFHDEDFSFGELQVASLIDGYFRKDEIIQNIYVLDDGLIRGFIQMNGTEICKIYIDPFFQNKGIGDALITYAIDELHADYLWALEKNTRAISFYQRHGFHSTGEKKFEEGTTEFLVKLSRNSTGGTQGNCDHKDTFETSRKIRLFIAMSLDGYIADSKGGVEWLKGQGNACETIDTYSEFVKDIDTILMGQNTYHQIVTELSPTEWVYRDFKTYVITHTEHLSTEKIHFTNISPVDLLKELKTEKGKDIWVCGGANIVQQLLYEDMIDQYYISVIPTLLGSGIRLFENAKREIKLKLLKTQTYNGITDLVYARR